MFSVAHSLTASINNMLGQSVPSQLRHVTASQCLPYLFNNETCKQLWQCFFATCFYCCCFIVYINQSSFCLFCIIFHCTMHCRLLLCILWRYIMSNCNIANYNLHLAERRSMTLILFITSAPSPSIQDDYQRYYVHVRWFIHRFIHRLCGVPLYLNNS